MCNRRGENSRILEQDNSAQYQLAFAVWHATLKLSDLKQQSFISHEPMLAEQFYWSDQGSVRPIHTSVVGCRLNLCILSGLVYVSETVAG